MAGAQRAFALMRATRLLLLLPLGTVWSRPSSGGFHGTRSRQQRACGTNHMAAFQVCHCACVIVDIGLNNGDSLLQWAPEALSLASGDASWPARREQLSQCIADNATTCYYGFEANPVFDKQLKELEGRLRAEERRVKLFTSTAFNVHSDPTEFLVEPRSSRSGNTGSTLEKEKRFAFIDRSGMWRQNVHKNVSVTERYRTVHVPSIDAAEFLADLTASSDFIALKLDIEGFEFTLLPYLLLTNPRALCALSVMAVEWHERMVPKYHGVVAHLHYMMTHSFCNVTTLGWH